MAIEASAERGVEYVIVHFGPLPFARPRGKVLRHASTEGTLYASRNAANYQVSGKPTCGTVATSGVPDRTIALTAEPADGVIRLRVRDHGPGISPAQTESGRLFRPFSKSVQDAANTAPGLGLGLALSRRLARSIGAELRHDTGVHDGAAFVLTLPRA